MHKLEEGVADFLLFKYEDMNDTMSKIIESMQKLDMSIR